MTDKLISVLMPVLDEARTVEGAVRSALSQRGVDVEVLVIDGRSTDGTPDIVRAMAAADPRVRLLDNPKVTIPAGLNVGLAAARGSIVARIDGHTSVGEGYLERAAAHLESDPTLGAIGGIRHGVSSSPVGRSIAMVLSSPFGIGDSVNHFGTTFQLTDHAAFGVYRTALARAIGGWDEALLVNEDVDFDYRILQTGAKIAFEPAMEVFWDVRDTLPALFRQYRRYGRGKAAMVRKNGRDAIRPRHLAAPVAVAGTAGLALVATKYPRVAAAAYSPYVAGVLAASVKAWRGRDTKAAASPAALPLAFAAVHYGWGVGFIEGYALGKSPQLSSAGASSHVLPTDA